MQTKGKRHGFLDRLIERMDRLDPSSLQTYVLRLARETGFLHTVFNTIQEGIIVIDNSQKIRYVNAAAQRLLGIEEDPGSHRIGRYLRDVDWARLLDADPEQWHRISRQEIEVFYPVHRHISFYLVPVRIDPESERLPLATLILRDVTKARKDTEKNIESQKVEAITMLAAGVAHELGNPLNSLNIHLQLLTRCVQNIQDESVAAEARELLAVATQEVTRLDAIVENFLHAIRPVPPQLQRLDVPDVVRQALDFMRIELEDRGILIESSLPANLPRLMADAEQLKQAFYNIIRNAIQAMPDGGVLRVECALSDDFMDVRFADTGRGISADDMSRIMEPYFTTRPEGTGLGLLIVDRIVRSHGGELGIESGGKRGAAFTVRLPLHDRQIRLLKAAAPLPADESRADGSP